MTSIDRRTFVAASAAAFAAPALRPRSAAAEAMLRHMDGGVPESYPTQEPDLVRSIVGKSHVDYDTVRAMVTTRPELAKAAWDWGFGDWETALGAASHMGRRDIAELLIEHGARPDLFTFAMLGQVDVVRALCDANPGIQSLLGPHGITLLQHARHGKEPAQSVVDYLEELGGADVGQTSLPLAEKDAQMYIGNYVPDGAPNVVFRVGWHDRRSTLTLARDDRTFRSILRVGDHLFAPGGAPSVRVEFDVRGSNAARLTIRDGALRLTAPRTPS